MHPTRRPFTSLLLAATVLFAASRPLPAATYVSVANEDDGAYAAGTQAMNEHRWADAVTSFDRVVNAKSKKSDAALYWKAYSLNKLGKGPLAMATCFQLRSHYTASQWNKDCSALTIDLHTDIQVPMPPMPAMPPTAEIYRMQSEINDAANQARGSDTDLKILALNSLLNRDPAQAIPLLRGVLTGNQPAYVKKHAIFVLAQSRSPEAQAILHDVIMGKMGLDLQREAIRMAPIFEGKRANDSLAEVYRSTSDPQIKRSIISAFFISQDAPRMVDLARNEKDLDLKRSIVSQLALMPDKAATDYMMELLK